MWSIELDRRERWERVGMTVDVYTPLRSFRLAEQTQFRTYTAGQFLRLLGRVEKLELVETYDFAYDVDAAIPVDGQSEDVVFILRKK